MSVEERGSALGVVGVGREVLDGGLFLCIEHKEVRRDGI
jgi:hypothetical protein